MTDELKPCPNPWCGSPRPPFLVWDLHRMHVQCVCGVRGPSSDHRLIDLISLDGVPQDVLEAEAIAAWNTRADLAADYEARIASALELASPLDDPRVKALVESATELHDKAMEKHQRHRSDIWPVIRKLRAALSALENRT